MDFLKLFGIEPDTFIMKKGFAIFLNSCPLELDSRIPGLRQVGKTTLLEMCAKTLSLFNFLPLLLLLSCAHLYKSNLETKNRQLNAATIADLEYLENWEEENWNNLENSIKECVQLPYRNFCQKDYLSCADSAIFRIQKWYCRKDFEDCMEEWTEYCKNQ